MDGRSASAARPDGVALEASRRHKDVRRLHSVVARALRSTWQASRRGFVVAASLQLVGALAVVALVVVGQMALEALLVVDRGGTADSLILMIVLLAMVTCSRRGIGSCYVR